MKQSKGVGIFGGPGRPKTGTSVRGKSISNPIPVPVDDEFPIRTPGSGIATPLASDGHEQKVLQRISSSSFEWPQVSMDAQPQAQQPPTSPSPEAHLRRTNQPTPLRQSLADVPVTPEGLRTGHPERKKSGLRYAFRKLFGKKKGSVSPSREAINSTGTRAEQHRSDPMALRSPREGPAVQAQKRSASLPINEFNRALRSHSIVADDIPRNSVSTKHDSFQATGEIQGRQRSATTPSLPWTPTSRPGYMDWRPGHMDWTGLSPRPASNHERSSKVAPAGEAEVPIGTAISHPNRRSRSLGELRDLSAGPLVIRRRSDEIRYWRESHDPTLFSPISSNKPDVEEPILVDDEDKENEQPQEPPQPFNFGPLGELAGMKITQAASLEVRVQRLEEGVRSIERVVYPSHRSSREPLHLQDPPKRKLHESRSASWGRQKTDDLEIVLPEQRNSEPQVRQLVQDSAPYYGRIRSSSYGRPSRASTVSSENPKHQFHDVSTTMMPMPEPEDARRISSSAATVRGFPLSTSAPPKDGPLTIEHFNILTNMILAEQAARQKLEMIVNDLQQELQAFRSAAPTSWSIPDQDHVPDHAQEGTSHHLEFSNFEHDDDSENDGNFVNQEVFQTPNEVNGSFGDEIFGEAIGHDNNDFKTATGPRTLSLSQMTMGKEMQAGLSF